MKCIKCGVSFKRSFEEKRRRAAYTEGEMVKLQEACPNRCGGEWFTLEKLHSIRKFKRRL